MSRSVLGIGHEVIASTLELSILIPLPEIKKPKKVTSDVKKGTCCGWHTIFALEEPEKHHVDVANDV